MRKKLNWEADPLRLPGLGAPRISIETQGTYHLTSAHIRAGSWLKGFFVIYVDSREKRIEVPSYAYLGYGMAAYNDDQPGVAELFVGPRGDGASTIFYSDEDGGSTEDVDVDAYTVVNVKFPRPLASYIPKKVRKLLRIPTYDWDFSIDRNYDKYGFTMVAYRYGW